MAEDETRYGPSIECDPDDVLRVAIHPEAGAVVVTAVGDIDLATSDRLAAVLRDEIGGGGGRIVLDLNGVTFMGSVGLATLLEAELAASEAGRSLLVVAGGSRSVVRTIEASGLSEHFALFGSVADALAPGAGG